MRTYKTEGIILKRLNFGEADRIITIYTKHYGKLKVLAKGVRRIKSRRGPNLELFNQSIIFLHQGRNFDIITEAEIKNDFSHLRKNLNLVSQAFLACELVDVLTREKQENQQVFKLLAQVLEELNRLGRTFLLCPVDEVFSGSGNQESEYSPVLIVRQECRTYAAIETFARVLVQELGFWPKDKFLKNPEEFIERLIERKLKTKQISWNKT